MEESACADAPIQIYPPVCGVTPMYRVQFRGYRSRWAAASRGITPRQFVRAQTGMDMAAIQASSRIFVEYAFAVEFRVTEAGPEHVLIADRWYVTEGSTAAHVRPVVDAFVRRHAERYGYVAPMDDGLWRDGTTDLAGKVHRVVPLDERPARSSRPILLAPTLTDASEFDPPHVERLRLLYTAALCVERGAAGAAPFAARLALTTSEFRGMVAGALCFLRAQIE